MSEDWLNIKIPNEKTPNLLERAGMVGVEPGSRRAPKSPKKTPKKYKKRKKAEMLPLPPTELEEYVILMSAIDIPEAVQARFLRIGPKIFRKQFKEQLQSGKYMATTRMARTVFLKGAGGDLNAAKFWLKAKAGWKETDGMEVTGKDGADLSPIDRSQRLAIIFQSHPEMLNKILKNKKDAIDVKTETPPDGGTETGGPG